MRVGRVVKAERQAIERAIKVRKDGAVLVVPKFERTIKRTMKRVTRDGATRMVHTIVKGVKYSPK
jgi:hypothetical protein